MKRLILILAVLLIFGIFGCNKIKELTKESCEAVGGRWNECGSACRGEDADYCVLMCVEYCECKNDEECPYGYECGEYIDDAGVCKIKK